VDSEDGSSNISSSGISEPSMKSESRERNPNPVLLPVVSADDERSAEILRPTIRHTLSRIDEVLMALHHARSVCHQYSQSEPGTEEEESTTSLVVDSAPEPPKRPRGRPRKITNLTDRPRAQNSLEGTNMLETGDLFRTKKTRRGRPLKVYERLDGETQQDYLIRIARVQKKPMPSFASTPEVSPAPKSKSKKTFPKKEATEEEKSVSKQKKLGLRDWSEVLGSAALVGFSPHVLARATQRCANLFGEGMTMRTMVEMPFSEKLADNVATYLPQAIPDLGIEHSETSSDSASSHPTSSGTGPSGRHVTRNRLPRNIPQQQNVFCAIDGCPRKITGFRDNPSLKRHLRKAHQIAEDCLEDYILSSDEEIDGAVHIDGFLKTARPLRGGYERKDKRKRDLSKSHVQVNDVRGSGSLSEA